MCSLAMFFVVTIVKALTSLTSLGAAFSTSSDMGWITDEFPTRIFLGIVDPTLLSHIQALHWLFLFLAGAHCLVVICGGVGLFGACTKSSKFMLPFFAAWAVELTLTGIVAVLMIADAGKYGNAAEVLIVMYFSKVDYYKSFGAMDQISPSPLFNGGIVKLVVCFVESIFFGLAHCCYRQLVDEKKRSRGAENQPGVIRLAIQNPRIARGKTGTLESLVDMEDH